MRRSWVTVLFVAAFAISPSFVVDPAAVTQTSDVTPQQLVDMSFTPSAINVSSGPQIVTVTLHVTDDLSGADFSGARFPQTSGIVFVSPSGQQTQRLDAFT